MYEMILIFHVIISAALIGFVLMQQGKGGGMGTAFGSGVSDALFGATSTANFLSRTTAVLATLFFVTSLGLSYLASHRAKQKNIEALPILPVTQSEVPATKVDVPAPTIHLPAATINMPAQTITLPAQAPKNTENKVAE